MVNVVLVYVGNGSPAVTEHLDVKGKIAVQLVVPQAHMVFERASVVPQAQALIKRGAVAVFNIMRQPGNELARDFSKRITRFFAFFVKEVDRATVNDINLR